MNAARAAMEAFSKSRPGFPSDRVYATITLTRHVGLGHPDSRKPYCQRTKGSHRYSVQQVYLRCFFLAEVSSSASSISSHNLSVSSFSSASSASSAAVCGSTAR